MENKQLLHIIPCTSQYESEINQVNKGELDNAGLWYLHGSLEKLFGFDKAVMTNCKALNLSKPFVYDANKEPINKLYFNGEIDCEVEGCDKPCVAFLYTTNETNETTWIQRGLVCIKEDTEACEYARQKMNEKAKLL